MTFRNYQDAKIAKLESENETLRQELADFARAQAAELEARAKELESLGEKRRRDAGLLYNLQYPTEQSKQRIGSFLDFFRNPLKHFRKG